MIVLRMSAVAGAFLALAGIASPASAQYGPPPGSYQETCRRVEMRGQYLTAICRDRRGEFRETQIDASRCRSFGNQNGRLACGR